MKNINQQTENTLNSLNGMKRAEVPAEFGFQVWQRILRTQQNSIPAYRMYRAAIFIGLLAGINMYTLLHNQYQPAQQTTGTENNLLQSYFTPDVQLSNIVR
ncbi:hypothetical protein C7N43_14635 [Sphingobacteriales bacterium UPWRP_1]|nr:hypothetical protein B6N25_08290 [Sphingobacteriales bacterium TSM_CSS]PSJ76306.1 hypothetical protein C7N43_14635 [Sphingobacteriales bacterium UPWRP_1]